MKKHVLVTCLLLRAAFCHAQAQTPPPAASLNSPVPDQKFLPGLSGNNSSLGSIYSPNLFDGSANVGIPIYDYSNDYGSFGIGINYNTKGITLDETSGPVGTHWALSAGGTISRTISDIPDEVALQFSSPSGTRNLFGRLYYYTQTSPPPFAYMDGENDNFNVSVGSLQFTFKLGKNGYVFHHPENRAKVDFYYNGFAYSFNNLPAAALPHDYGFKITDVQGNQYFFSPGDWAQQLFADGFKTSGGQALEYTANWNISKILFANGQQITYDYAETAVPSTNFNLGLTSSIKEASNNSSTSSPLYFITAASAYSYSHILTAIHYPNNITATFEFDQTQTPPINGGECSKSIKQVTVGPPGACLHYRFNKVYRAAGSNTEYPFDNACNFNTQNARLMLKSIDILSCDGNITEPYYSFDYSPVGMPPRLSGKRDFFGYNNGDPNNGDLQTTPAHFHAFSGLAVAGQNRSVTTTESTLSASNLYKVNNAYGGSVTFQYELHSGLSNVISNLPTDNRFMGKDVADGLRLKAITEDDKFHPGQSKTTQFSYSGGQFFLNGGYYSYPSHMTGSTIDEYTTGSSWISAHQFVNGSNHGYSQVTAEVRDYNTNLLSKTVYNYTNLLTSGVSSLQNSGKKYYEAPYTDKQYIKDWELGLPLVITQYDQNNNIVSRTTNTFTSVVDNTAALSGLENNTKTLRSSSPVNVNYDPVSLPVIATDTYLPYTGISLLNKTVTEKFVSNTQAVSDTVTYTYDNRNNLVITQVRNSRGQYSKANNVYNYDVSGPGVLGGNFPGTDLYNMTFDGLEKVVSTERWRNGSTIFNDQLLDASITGYSYQGGKVRLKSLYTLLSKNPVSYTVYTGMSQGSPQVNPYSRVLSAYNNSSQPVTNFQKASEVLLYDFSSNPLETKLLDQQAYKAMLWDSARGWKMAEVSNARNTDIAYTGFENTLDGVAYTGSENIVNGNFHYKQSGVADAAGMAGNYGYKLPTSGPAAIISTGTLTSGKEYLVTFWCSNGVPVLNGAGLSNISLTATATVGSWSFYQARFTAASSGPLNFQNPSGPIIQLDELRLMPSGCSMQSWNYTPLFGASSTTDGTGRITYYEYDPLGRQTISRDQEGNILSKTDYHVSQ